MVVTVLRVLLVLEKFPLSKQIHKLPRQDAVGMKKGVDVDVFNLEITRQLINNCRVTYRELARQTGLSTKAVQKRVKKLIDTQRIAEIGIELSHAMLNSEMVWAEIWTDRTEDELMFLDLIGNNPWVTSVAKTASGNYLAECEVVGSQGRYELGNFLRGLEGVTKVKLSTLLFPAIVINPLSKIFRYGQKATFSHNQLRVLRCLTIDARMPVPQIARQSKLSAKTVRKLLKELYESGAVHFTIRTLHQPSGWYCLILRIHLRESVAELAEIEEWLAEKCFYSYSHSNLIVEEPVLWAYFVMEQFRWVEPIARLVKVAPWAKDVDILIRLQVRLYKGLSHLRLEELLTEAGL